MQFRPSKNLFIHIDCDCFFASCEMMRDPSIRDKCVCVGGDIVLTSNYRARKYGVKLGTPGWEVENMIPKGELVMLPPDLALYGDVSDRMNAYLANWSNRVDIFGIDESWMEVTGIPECLGLGYEDFLLKVQNDLLDQVGVPASVGLSNTRLRAKILGEVYKPLGRAVGPSSDTFFSHAGSLHFSKIPFIGRRLQDRLRYYVGDETVRSFMNIGFWKLKELIGTSATDVWLELMGVSAYKHRGPERVEKSISATRSFNHAKTSDKYFLWEHLLMNFERAYRRLIEKDLETDRLYISFRDKEKRWFGFDTKFARLTNSKTFLIQQMKQLFEKTHNANILYRSTGVTFTGLEPALPKQFTLEEVGSIQILENQKDLEKIINEINKKYGRMTVTRGGSGSVDPRYMERFQKKKLKKTGAARVRRVRGMRIQ